MALLRRLALPLAILAFLALLIYTSLGERRHGAEACVRFQGRKACGSAWAASPEEAVRSAQSAACSQLASGVGEVVACGQMPPESVRHLER